MTYTPPNYDPDGGDYGPISPGMHVAVVETLELRYAKDNDGVPDFGRPYVAWTYVVAEGEFKNRKVWNNSSLKDTSVNMPGGWYESGMAAIGESFPEEVNREWDDEESMVEYVASLVCGRLVTVAISNRKYQGKVQNDVNAVLVYDGDMPQLDTSELAPEVAPPEEEPEPEEEEKPKAKKPPAKKAPPKRAPPPRKASPKSDTDF